MDVAAAVIALHAVDDSEIRLEDAPVDIRRHAHALVLEPLVRNASCNAGDPRPVRLARLGRPVEAVRRSKIPRDASEPVVDDKVVLHLVAPQDGILEAPRDVGIHAAGHHNERLDSVFAQPYSPAAADREHRSVWTPREGEVRLALDELASVEVERQAFVFPRTVHRRGAVDVRLRLGVDAVDGEGSVLAAEELWVVPRTDHLDKLEVPVGTGRHAVRYLAVRPEHVTLRLRLLPARDEKMVPSVDIDDVPAPVRVVGLLHAVAHVARLDVVAAPAFGGQRTNRLRFLEAVHEASAGDDAVPSSGARTLNGLS